jgi:hypothetical protein
MGEKYCWPLRHKFSAPPGTKYAGTENLEPLLHGVCRTTGPNFAYDGLL